MTGIAEDDWRPILNRKIAMNAAALIAQAEENLVKLEADFKPLHDEYTRLSDSIEPVLSKMHDLETRMDQRKEALHEARQIVAKLRS